MSQGPVTAEQLLSEALILFRGRASSSSGLSNQGPTLAASGMELSSTGRSTALPSDPRHSQPQLCRQSQSSFGGLFFLLLPFSLIVVTLLSALFAAHRTLEPLDTGFSTAAGSSHPPFDLPLQAHRRPRLQCSSCHRQYGGPGTPREPGSAAGRCSPHRAPADSADAQVSRHPRQADGRSQVLVCYTHSRAAL